jgi:hypothetical protein
MYLGKTQHLILKFCLLGYRMLLLLVTLKCH